MHGQVTTALCGLSQACRPRHSLSQVGKCNCIPTNRPIDKPNCNMQTFSTSMHIVFSDLPPSLHQGVGLEIYEIVSTKRGLTHAFSSFQITLYSKRYLGPLQIISYTLEIGLSIITLLWPEFLIMRTFQRMLSPGKFYIALFIDTISYT